MLARHFSSPLVRLLLGLTVVTGVVDAVSFLFLGRVFVANMTGNVRSCLPRTPCQGKESCVDDARDDGEGK
jgi:Protein of unknown function (DUF1275)